MRDATAQPVDHTVRNRLATLHAVLLGVLIIGSALQIDSEGPATLWHVTTTDAAFAKLVLIPLMLCLMAGAVTGSGLAHGLTQALLGLAFVTFLARTVQGLPGHCASGGVILALGVSLAVIAPTLGAAAHERQTL